MERMKELNFWRAILHHVLKSGSAQGMRLLSYFISTFGAEVRERERVEKWIARKRRRQRERERQRDREKEKEKKRKRKRNIRMLILFFTNLLSFSCIVPFSKCFFVKLLQRFLVAMQRNNGKLTYAMRAECAQGVLRDHHDSTTE